MLQIGFDNVAALLADLIYLPAQYILPECNRFYHKKICQESNVNKVNLFVLKLNRATYHIE